MNKHVYVAICSLFMACPGISAEQPLEQLAEPVFDPSGYVRRPLNSDRMKASSIPSGEWVDAGEGMWFDDLFSYYQLVTPGDGWAVHFEKSASDEAWYRLLPYGPDSPVARFLEEDDSENFVYINTTNPDKVYIPDFKAYGKYLFSQHVDENAWWGDEDYGTLRDGVISFPANCFCHRIPENQGPWSRVNTQGKMKIVLPGGKADDFALKLESPFCPDENGDVRITFSIGEDVASVKYALLQGEYFAEGSNASLVASQGTELRGTALRATPHERAIFSLLAVALDREGQLVNSAHCQFFGPDSADPDTWQVAGEATFIESFFSPLYENLTPEVLTVPYEESLEHPGRIRLVEPYSVHGFNPVLDHPHSHFIFIDASAPSAVYVEHSAPGVDFGGGQSAVWSLAGRYVHYGQASDAYNAGLFGTRSGNVITMPDYSLLVGEKNYAGGEFTPTGSGFRVTLNPSQSGIESVVADTAEAEAYFTLDGRALAGKPSLPGVYVRVSGGKAVKVAVK